MKLQKEVFVIFGIDYMKKHFTHQQRYIIVAVLSLFLPFYMCGAVILFLTLRLMWTGEIQNAYHRDKKNKFIFIFCFLSIIVSLFYKNYLGGVVAFCILIALLFVSYYKAHITPQLFNFISNIIIVLSVFGALYGLIEYIGILNSVNIDQFELIIFNKPQDRINSVFFNANYYAMMIEFFICLTFYKILKIKNVKKEFQKFFYYILVICINLFMLILTGCRTAWPTLAAGILVMLIVDKHYKTCACIFTCVLFIGLFFLMNPSAFPRVDNIVSYFFTRTDIWKAAIEGIKDNLLFGQGPFTYHHIYHLYDGHPTQHAHNIYLDPLLSFGIVGLGVISPLVYSHLRSIYLLWKSKVNKTLTALIVCYIVMILVHGLLDYTIFFVQTALLFLFVTSSFDMYKSLK